MYMTNKTTKQTQKKMEQKEGERERIGKRNKEHTGEGRLG